MESQTPCRLTDRHSPTPMKCVWCPEWRRTPLCDGTAAEISVGEIGPAGQLRYLRFAGTGPHEWAGSQGQLPSPPQARPSPARTIEPSNAPRLALNPAAFRLASPRPRGSTHGLLRLKPRFEIGILESSDDGRAVLPDGLLCYVNPCFVADLHGFGRLVVIDHL